MWYAWRTWIEQGFRDLKSDGWDLSKTRMREAERVARWWTAAALATLWVLEAGAEARRLEIPAKRTHRGAEQPAVTSLFALGKTCLADQLPRGRVRRLRRLPRPDWPNDPAQGNPPNQHNSTEIHLAVPL